MKTLKESIDLSKEQIKENKTLTHEDVMKKMRYKLKKQDTYQDFKNWIKSIFKLSLLLLIFSCSNQEDEDFTKEKDDQEPDCKCTQIIYRTELTKVNKEGGLTLSYTERNRFSYYCGESTNGKYIPNGYYVEPTELWEPVFYDSYKVVCPGEKEYIK